MSQAFSPLSSLVVRECPLRKERPLNAQQIRALRTLKGTGITLGSVRIFRKLAARGLVEPTDPNTGDAPPYHITAKGLAAIEHDGGTK